MVDSATLSGVSSGWDGLDGPWNVGISNGGFEVNSKRFWIFQTRRSASQNLET